MIAFILADLRRFWSGAVAIIVLLALSVALSSVVTLQERAVRLGTARASDKFDLVIGAAGSDTQLTLSSVFLQPSPLPLMSGDMLGKLANDSRVAFAAPIGFGDSAMGFPIVGTTTALISALSPQLAEGAQFARLGEAVIGSAVDLPVGARVNPMHGTVETGGHAHSEVSYQVAGKMAPTGTAWDRAILVPIRTVWQLHGMEAHEEHDHTDHVEKSGNGFGVLVNEKLHDHDHEIDVDAPLDEAFDADSPGVPAILVKPRTIADAYRLRQEYRSDRTLAIFPAEVLTRLYSTLGDARSLLLGIAVGTQGIVVFALLLVAVMHIGVRKRQIGALRALGAPVRSIMAIVWGELFFLLLLGICLGLAIGYAVARAITSWLTATTAVRMPVEFAMSDVWLAVGFIIVAAVVSLVPALMALRMSAASALRS
ncbi:ftsX-like permease family protein [Ochrobactrum quorumnocens]|uniref:FtsX-like permease family protein n=1 Tax=Ochrobactrum quorumnocens TaxID=271865 RepID=A0A248UDJ2_9HYPH|nr:ABC transporter permease [[Ochrobactrum] quorumnocens]ASV84389.1 ftsX-like permease family protein [[Ochrobactrum] quorumnocens]